MSHAPHTPETGGEVSDASKGNWVDRFAPAATRPYLRLSRADRPIGTWLLLIPCLWAVLLASLTQASFGRGEVWILLGCAIGAFVMRGAGCTWNDITDRKIDGQVERTRSRPIPSGQVSVRGALVWMLVQIAIGAAILFSFNNAAILLGFVSLLPVAIYPFAKRFTWWPQVFLGIAFNWGALLAWTAVTGSLSAPAVALYFSGIAWTLFYDTIYAHQDKEDDAMIGVKSTARLFGDNTHTWLHRFMIVSVVMMEAAVVGALPASVSALQLVVAVFAPWAFGWHMVWQMGRLKTEDADNCLRLFRSNRDTGLIAALFLAVAVLL